MLKSKAIARWQSLLFLVGVALIGTPDGVEVVNLTASVLLAIAFVPYGIQIIRRTPGVVIAESYDSPRYGGTLRDDRGQSTRQAVFGAPDRAGA